MNQKILEANGEYSILDSWFHQTKCCMLVCGKSIARLKINDYLKDDAELQKIVIGELLQEIPKQKNILE